MAASGWVDTSKGAGPLAELRAQLRAATLRQEAAASDEALADLTPVQDALERAGARVADARLAECAWQLCGRCSGFSRGYRSTSGDLVGLERAAIGGSLRVGSSVGDDPTYG